MYINDNEIAFAGLDSKRVLSLARRLSIAAIEAQNMGIKIFGGSGTGSLRFDTNDGRAALVIAKLDGNFDGGDGQEMRDDKDLWRGE